MPRDLATLSAVVPNYNHAHHLPAALSALLGQSQPMHEIIVVDDASTDGSIDYLSAFAARERRVRIIRHERNLGVAAAMNRGLAEARAETVCFAAADDLLLPDFARTTLSALADCPGAAFACSDPAEFSDRPERATSVPLALSAAPRCFSPAELARLLARNAFSFSSNTIVYRREHLAALGGFQPALRWYTDWFANFVLAFRHGMTYVPGVFALFRVSPGSYSAAGRRSAADQRAVLDAFLAELARPDFESARESFRRAALVPESSLRTLGWLLGSSHAGFITPRLVVRTVGGSLWRLAMPHTPIALRRFARRLLGTLSAR